MAVVRPCVRHVPFTEKQPPFLRSMPLAYDVVVPLSKKFQPVPLPPILRSEPGVVVPMPTFPVLEMKIVLVACAAPESEPTTK